MTRDSDQLNLAELLERTADAHGELVTACVESLRQHAEAHSDLLRAAAERLRQRDRDDLFADLPPLMKVSQVARVCGVSRETIDGLIARGELVAINLNDGTSKQAHNRIARTQISGLVERLQRRGERAAKRRKGDAA